MGMKGHTSINKNLMNRHLLVKIISELFDHIVIQSKKERLRGSCRVPTVMLAWDISTGQVSSATAGVGSPRHSNCTSAGLISAPSSSLSPLYLSTFNAEAAPGVTRDHPSIF